MRLQTNFYDILRKVSKTHDYPKGYIESIGDTVLKTLHDSMADLESDSIRLYRLGTFKINKKRFMKRYEKIWNDIIYLEGKKVKNKYIKNKEIKKWIKIKYSLLDEQN